MQSSRKLIMATGIVRPKQAWREAERSAQSSRERSVRQGKTSNNSISNFIELIKCAQDNNLGHPTPPPISTNVKPSRYSLDNATPQAQKLQDVFDASRLRSSSTSSLECRRIVTHLHGVKADFMCQ